MTTSNPFPTERESRQFHPTTATKISKPPPAETAHGMNVSPSPHQHQHHVEQQPHPYLESKTPKQAVLSSPQVDASLQAEQELDTITIPETTQAEAEGGEALKGEQKQSLLKEKELLSEDALASTTLPPLHTQPSPVAEIDLSMNIVTNKMHPLYTAAKDFITFITAHVYIVLGVLVTAWPAWKLLYRGATALFQDFAPILLMSGFIAGAATILGYLLYRSPLDEVSLAQADESSAVTGRTSMAAEGGGGGGVEGDESTLMGHSEPVSGASIEDLITPKPKKGEGGEEEHHGIYEKALEFFDPGKEMVGDVIMEEEEEGKAERGENAIGTSNDDNNSGYQSDSDVPGVVLQGVHHK